MSGKRRKRSQLIRDRRRIADLYLQGWTQAAIGDELHIDQSTVSRDLVALQEAWQESALIDINEAKARELAKVDRLEREYWVAWERSCEDAETVKQRAIPVPAGTDGATAPKVASVEKTSKGQAGDPRFLAGVQWCIDRRCKIIGVDAPVKADFTSAGEGLTIIFARQGDEQCGETADEAH